MQVIPNATRATRNIADQAENAAIHAGDSSSRGTPGTAAPATMRAIVQRAYGTPDVFSLEEIPRPTVAENEVLVRVHAAGLDRGTWHLMTGKPYLLRIMGFGFRRPSNPVPGLDIAGTVIAIGGAVTRFSVGDEVFGVSRGAFAEYACALEEKLARKPATLSFEEAAVTAISGLTAIQSLRDAGQLAKGQRVLILGASGGVGSFAVQIAKALGAEVTAVCSASKAEMVRNLGADHILDYARDDFADGTRRYDLILDIAGNPAFARLRRALVPGGKAVLVGGEGGGDWLGVVSRALVGAVQSLIGGKRFALFASREHFSDLEALASLAAEGKLHPAVHRSYPLVEVPDAMRSLEAGQVQGKLAIQVLPSS